MCFEADEKLSGCLPIPNFKADRFSSDEWVLESSKKVVETFDPHILYILFAGPDDGGHVYGNALETAISTLINPKAMNDTLKITDNRAMDFINFLKETGRFDDSLIIITADYGMSTTGTDENKVTDGYQVSDYSDFFNTNSKWVVEIKRILNEYGYLCLPQIRQNPTDGVYEWCVCGGGTK